MTFTAYTGLQITIIFRVNRFIIYYVKCEKSEQNVHRQFPEPMWRLWSHDRKAANPPVQEAEPETVYFPFYKWLKLFIRLSSSDQRLIYYHRLNEYSNNCCSSSVCSAVHVITEVRRHVQHPNHVWRLKFGLLTRCWSGQNLWQIFWNADDDVPAPPTGCRVTSGSVHRDIYFERTTQPEAFISRQVWFAHTVSTHLRARSEWNFQGTWSASVSEG